MQAISTLISFLLGASRAVLCAVIFAGEAFYVMKTSMLASTAVAIGAMAQ